MCMCGEVYVISVRWCPQGAANDTGYPAVGIRGNCKSPILGARNQTEDLPKTSVCSDLLPHLSSPKEVESHLKVNLVNSFSERLPRMYSGEKKN